MRAAAPHIVPRATIVSATKGLEAGTLLRMSEVVAQELGAERPVVVLSGPSFALEVAQQLPTAVLAASLDADATEFVQAEFRGPSFRLYGSADVVGVEIGGALKNIIAIAAGVVEGLGLGHNALAALITRGLAEVTRLACAAGGRRETLAGLSGLGDLVLTCTGSLSRNRHVGIELARGRRLADILAGMKMVAEGVPTTTAALALGAQYGVELPIATQMAEVLAGRTDVRTAVEALMLRRQRSRSGVRLIPMSVLGRIRESLSRTKQQIVERFDEIVRRADAPERRSRPIDVETLDALEELLISADVGVAASERIVGGGEEAIARRRRASRSREAGDPRHLRGGRCAGRGRPSPQGHADRRRQRHRQDDDGREAGEPAQKRGAAAAHLRGRHVPRGRRRAARDLGGARGRRHGAGARRRRSRRPSCSTRSRRGRRRGAIRFSSTRPGGCTRAST